jgi:hypothetical protein
MYRVVHKHSKKGKQRLCLPAQIWSWGDADEPGELDVHGCGHRSAAPALPRKDFHDFRLDLLPKFNNPSRSLTILISPQTPTLVDLDGLRDALSARLPLISDIGGALYLAGRQAGKLAGWLVTTKGHIRLGLGPTGSGHRRCGLKARNSRSGWRRRMEWWHMLRGGSFDIGRGMTALFGVGSNISSGFEANE